MSGPKVDIATLRRQEQMRLEEAREKRRELADKIEEMIKHIESFMNPELELVMHDKSFNENSDRIRTLKGDCSKKLQKLLKEVKEGNETLNVKDISEKTEKIKQEFYENIKIYRNVFDELAQASMKYQQLEKNRNTLEQLKKRNLILLSAKVEIVSEINKETISETDVRELADTFQEELKQFIETNYMLGKHKNSLLLIHQDLQEILHSGVSLDMKEKRMKRLFGEFQKMTAMIKSEAEDIQAMYQEYLKESFDLPTPAIDISEFSSKAEIETAIKLAKEQASLHLSKDYIKRQIDEVMIKNGYDVVKSDMLSEVEQSGRVLYGVNHDTAIDVFVSDDNQVTMRIVGIGFDSDISEAENERLYQQQCAFCSMHPKLTAELAMRGVILQTKKHLAPDKKYNKKIQTKTKNVSQSGSRAKKELKRTELKTMCKE